MVDISPYHRLTIIFLMQFTAKDTSGIAPIFLFYCFDFRYPPSTFMAYQLTPFHRSVCTSIVFHSTKPCWSFKKVERLDLAKIPNQVCFD